MLIHFGVPLFVPGFLDALLRFPQLDSVWRLGLMRQDRAGGLSLRQIAGQLNERLIPNKDGGTWQANTVRLILARA